MRCRILLACRVRRAGRRRWLALYWHRVEIQGEQAGRAPILAAGAATDPEGLRLRLPDGRAQPQRRYPLLTPDYRQEFKDRANKDIIPQARERQLVSQANIVGVGVLDAQRNSGSVMVYMNRTVTDKSKQAGLRRQPPAGRLQARSTASG